MTKRLLAIAALALSMPLAQACAPTLDPVGMADQTVIDEKAGLAVEVAYTGAALAATYAIKAGVFDRPRIDQIVALDNQAYALVQKARAAYDLGNAADYQTFSKQGMALVAEMLKLMKGS